MNDQEKVAELLASAPQPIATLAIVLMSNGQASLQMKYPTVAQAWMLHGMLGEAILRESLAQNPVKPKSDIVVVNPGG